MIKVSAVTICVQHTYHIPVYTATDTVVCGTALALIDCVAACLIAATAALLSFFVLTCGLALENACFLACACSKACHNYHRRFPLTPL